MDDNCNNATTSGFLNRMLSRAVPAWRDRPDTEHEQAAVRVLAGTVACIYVQYAIWANTGAIDMGLLAKMTVFFLAPTSIIVWLIIDPAVNTRRRVFGCLTDNCAATSLLYLNGNLAAPVFVIYLWVTFGNGFRFGKKYLLLSMVLSVIGFTSVMLLSPMWSVQPAVNVGLLTGLVALPMYVATLLNRLERSLQNERVANRAKSNFLATMSHEIRTPLNGLIGVLDLLDTTPLRDKQRHYVDLMKRSSTWLLNVISDSLDFSKIEADELVIEPASADLRTVVHELCDVYGEVARAKGVAFRSEVADSLPVSVLCDAGRLTQVLNNLLNNACKFTDEGEVALQVGSEPVDSDKVRLSFRVSDSGIGIEQESLEEIFSPFKQVEATSSRSHGGTGLGLAISRRLVDLMGGDITVTSRPDMGTVFAVSLTAPLAAETETPARKPGTDEICWNRPPSLLLVEDNDINQEVATSYLEQLGCRVRVAADGYEALRMFREKTYDLILMDCQMPRMDGYETTRRLRHLEAGVCRSIIIALTAHVMSADRKECLAAGMDDYMGKPFRIETLAGLLRKWLGPLVSTEDLAAPEIEPIITAKPTGTVTEARQDSTLHDLRNALSAVVGCVELAQLCADDPEQQNRQLSNALVAAERAADLLQDRERIHSVS